MTEPSNKIPRIYDTQELRVAAERELQSLTETGYGSSSRYAFGNIAAFLTHVLDEDEKAARDCAEVYPSPWDLADRGWMATVRGDGPSFHAVTILEQQQAPGGWLGDRLTHIARHDPATVLARIAADRQILALHAIGQDPCDAHDGVSMESTACDTVRLLALPYADRPGYRGEWKP